MTLLFLLFFLLSFGKQTKCQNEQISLNTTSLNNRLTLAKNLNITAQSYHPHTTQSTLLPTNNKSEAFSKQGAESLFSETTDRVPEKSLIQLTINKTEKPLSLPDNYNPVKVSNTYTEPATVVQQSNESNYRIPGDADEKFLQLEKFLDNSTAIQTWTVGLSPVNLPTYLSTNHQFNQSIKNHKPTLLFRHSIPVTSPNLDNSFNFSNQRPAQTNFSNQTYPSKPTPSNNNNLIKPNASTTNSLLSVIQPMQTVHSLCSEISCGANATCIAADNKITCLCNPHYRGNPYVVCKEACSATVVSLGDTNYSFPQAWNGQFSNSEELCPNSGHPKAFVKCSGFLFQLSTLVNINCDANLSNFRIENHTLNFENGFFNISVKHGGRDTDIQQASSNTSLKHDKHDINKQHGFDNTSFNHRGLDANMQDKTNNTSFKHGGQDIDIQNRTNNTSFKRGGQDTDIQNRTNNASFKHGGQDTDIQNRTNHASFKHGGQDTDVQNRTNNTSFKHGGQDTDVQNRTNNTSFKHGRQDTDVQNRTNNTSFKHGGQDTDVQNRTNNTSFKHGGQDTDVQNRTNNTSFKHGRQDTDIQNRTNHASFKHGGQDTDIQNRTNNTNFNHRGLDVNKQHGAYNTSFNHGGQDINFLQGSYNTSFQEGEHDSSIVCQFELISKTGAIRLSTSRKNLRFETIIRLVEFLKKIDDSIQQICPALWSNLVAISGDIAEMLLKFNEESQDIATLKLSVVSLIESFGDKVIVPKNVSSIFLETSLLVGTVYQTGFANRNKRDISSESSDFGADVIVHHKETDETEKVAAFHIPSEAFYSAKESNPGYNGQLSVTYFKNKNVFPSMLNTSQPLSISLGVNTSVSFLQNPLRIQYTNQPYKMGKVENPENPLKVIRTELGCRFWNFSTNQWSSSGCCLNQSQFPPVCQCNHLTNFALLMSITSVPNDLTLSIISDVGCILSIITLVLTILAQASNQSQFQSRSTKILVNVCVNLMIAYIIFVAGIGRTNNKILCDATTALLQYFLLTTWCWLTVYSCDLYLSLVKVFRDAEGFLLRSIVFSYFTPFLIMMLNVTITLEVLDQSDGLPTCSGEKVFATSSYRPDHMCWLHGNSLYFGFLLPVGIMLVVNTVLYVIILVKVVWEKKKMFSKGRRFSTKKSIRISCTLFITMGLVWVLGYFMLLSQDPQYLLTMSWIFAISVTTQGIVIFVTTSLLNNAIVSEWVRRTRSVLTSVHVLSGSAPSKSSQGSRDKPAAHEQPKNRTGGNNKDIATASV